MEIKTRFNNGDVVWYFGNDGLKNFKIDSICIEIRSKSDYSIKYMNEFMNGKGVTVTKSEKEVFESKEALIAQL